jgi:hypothetical protein
MRLSIDAGLRTAKAACACLYGCLAAREPDRYRLPDAQRIALSRVFAVSEATIDRVVVEPESDFARMHGDILATTRVDSIYLTGMGDDFAADANLLLHEYFHVIRQWNTGELTVGRYVLQLLRKGYWRNKYEIEAREFADARTDEFRRLLTQNSDAQGAVDGGGAGDTNVVTFRAPGRRSR